MGQKIFESREAKMKWVIICPIQLLRNALGIKLRVEKSSSHLNPKASPNTEVREEVDTFTAASVISSTPRFLQKHQKLSHQPP